MAELHPAVTVGLMVYNEEKHLSGAIESVLKQDFSDYEIIIGDNASQDRTGEIGLSYVKKDSRIQYVKHPQNLGALNNFNFLVRAARGRYFVLAGGHDFWSANYLSVQTEALDRNPTAVLVHVPTIWVDDEGMPTSRRSGFIDTSGQDVNGRFNLAMWNNQNGMYGLFRLDALRKTRLQLPIVSSDLVMLCEMALQGDIILVPGATWYRRQNRAPETREERLQRYHKILFRKPRPVLLSHWPIPWGIFTAVLRGKISLRNRLLLILSAFTAFLRFAPFMAWDVYYLFARLFHLNKIFSRKSDAPR
jgi:glycosyltransferase involved in cell wall biosynthesis